MMTGFFAFILPVLVLPIALFIVFVLPIWLILSYRSRREVKQGLTDDEKHQLRQLVYRSEQLAERIKTLEKILDVESPNWRDKHE